MTEKGGGFFEIHLHDPRLVLPRFGSHLQKVTFDPELALTNPDAIILDAGHPLLRKLIEIVKAEFFTNKGTYGRNAYFFSDQVETVVYLYNFLVRFTVGLREKRVIEELVTLAVDSYTDQLVPFEKILPAVTTRNLPFNDLAEHLTDALSCKPLDRFILKKIQERRIKLIEERQELYKKILVDSNKTDQPAWLDDIIHIEDAGYDLLTVTIVQPL
jgi:hypothetical protein